MRRAGLAVATLVAVLAGLVTAIAPSTPAAAAPREHRVVMFTDSVGLGAKSALPAAFPPDWEVNVDGQPARFVEQIEQNFVRPRLATNPGWFGDHVVIAAGYNYPYWDPARFDSSIDSLIDTLVAAGVKNVHWVTLREIDPQYISASAWRQVQPYYWYFPTVNAHLDRALERHPELSLVEWRYAANQPGLTYDAIHLNTTGARLYSSLIRASVDAAATRVPDGSTTRVVVPGAAGAAAVAVNLTTTDPRTLGYLIAHPCRGAVPLVSVHNHRRGEVVAHSAIVPLDPDGAFCVTTRVATNLVVDVTGLFPADSGLRGVTPTRWFDSRGAPGGARLPAGGTVELSVDDVRAAAGVVGDPTAVAVVATSVDAAGPGFLRVATCGSPAGTSNVNYLDGFAVPNLAIVEPDESGRICVSTLAASHVVVDLFATFDGRAAAAAGTATRIFDSRDGGARVGTGSVTVVDVADAGVSGDAAGVVLNLTATDALAPGFVTAYPCAAGRPETSNLNVVPGGVAANAAIIAPDASGTICVFSLGPTHLVVDVLGEIGTGFAGIAPVRVLDTRTALP